MRSAASRAFERLGATPVAMTLGDVIAALQQGMTDGADAALHVYIRGLGEMRNRNQSAWYLPSG